MQKCEVYSLLIGKHYLAEKLAGNHNSLKKEAEDTPSLLQIQK
jgi:hypothetical protein